ncbi:NEL domain-containing protein, partial [Klebsiella pneumoniae]|nr:NEL domain-containing protein [Klebsiella pneumoniae]
MAFYARIQLQNALRLPGQPQGMLFDYLARLSDATLQSLADAVWIDASASRLRLWAADQAFWPRWLQRLRPAPFEALRE